VGVRDVMGAAVAVAKVIYTLLNGLFIAIPLFLRIYKEVLSDI
jgi:hypothetical protein